MKRGDFNWDWDNQTTFKLDDEEEILYEDKLNRQQYAEYLYYYLEKKGKLDNTVINLNSEWGAGKTFFIKRLYNSIKDIHPCVYIDAWKQDFSDDAFLTLFSSLSQQLQKYSGSLDARLMECGQAIGRFTKGVIPAILSGLMKKYTGIDSVGDIAKEASELMLKEHQEKLESIQSLKKELALWSRMAFERGFSSPIFIFIDELDRCRPNYAISLLEIVKHIFDIKNFVFIIATDTDQLQHSIKNVYGNDFSANDYLGRFFHRRFSLKSPKLKILIHDVVNKRIANNSITLNNNIFPLTKNLDDFIENIASVFDAFNLNLRDSIRNTERLLDLITSNIINKHIDYILLTILMVIYDKHRELIDRQTGKLPITSIFSESVKSSNYLRGASQAKVVLKLETSSNKIKVNFRYSGAKRFTFTINRDLISLHLHQYIEVACNFISSVNSIKAQIKQSGDNRLLSVPAEPNEIETLKYLQGALLYIDEEKQFYNFTNYIEFIELANAFE